MQVINKKILAFRVYYGKSGGAVFSAVGTMQELYQAWQIAPNYNVGLIALYYNQRDDNNWITVETIEGKDMYSFDGQLFYASDDSRKIKGRILYGRWFSQEEMLKFNTNCRYIRRAWPFERGGEFLA